MKKKKLPQQKTVTIAYTFQLRFAHPDHLKQIMRELVSPKYKTSMSGAGLANDGECYNFGYAQVKKGRIIKEEE